MEWLPQSRNVAFIVVFAISNTTIKQAFARICTSNKVVTNAENYSWIKKTNINVKNYFQAGERS